MDGVKIYSKRTKETPSKYGEVVFEWTAGDNVTKSCTQHQVQPAIFFEELLREAGYRMIGEE